MFQGLKHLHKLGICHNNISTSSVFIEEKTYTLKIRNFENITSVHDDFIPGLILDFRSSDIYNSAILLFQAITGIHPFGTDELRSLMDY